MNLSGPQVQSWQHTKLSGPISWIIANLLSTGTVCTSNPTIKWTLNRKHFKVTPQTVTTNSSPFPRAQVTATPLVLRRRARESKAKLSSYYDAFDVN